MTLFTGNNQAPTPGTSTLEQSTYFFTSLKVEMNLIVTMLSFGQMAVCELLTRRITTHMSCFDRTRLLFVVGSVDGTRQVPACLAVPISHY